MADTKGIILKGLAAVLGSAASASILLTTIPAEESGRKVAVTMAATDTPVIRHISGPQYLQAYLDAVGVPTACDGITRGVRLGQTYTEARCTALLQGELIKTAGKVVSCVPGLYGRPEQSAAAVSLAYNIGWPSFCKSTAARLFNAGQWRAGCDAFEMWIKAKGKVLAGLVSRRRRERILCLTGLPA